MRPTETCSKCGQSEGLEGNQKVLLETITAQKVQIRTLEDTVRNYIGIEKLVEDILCSVNATYATEFPITALFEIKNLITDYQKERGGE